MNPKSHCSLRPKALAMAVCTALGVLGAAQTVADPLLQVKLFRDTDVMFRDSDMSRWVDNYVEIGVGWNSDDSYRFGQFSGLTEQGAFPMLGFNWQKRDGQNDAKYWRIYGSNLGLDSRKFMLEGGEQGRWGFNASVDQLKRHETESARFVHQGLGTSTLTENLAAGSVSALDGSLATFGIVQGRDIYRLGANALFSSNWDFKINYREDRRDGTRITGLSSAATGWTVGTINLPYQIDDKTQQVEAILSYTAKKAQFQLAYNYSRFENALTAFQASSPYNASTAPTVSMGLMPDNDYHQIMATGAYNFTKDTRLKALLSYGIARQDEEFRPYTLGNISVPLPRNSLDGRVDKTVLDVALTTKPMDKMNLKLAYQYRDNNNKTDRFEYLYGGRDGNQASSNGPPTGNRRINTPMSTREQKVIVDADYQIADRTTLRASFENRRNEYTLADRADTENNKLSLELRRPVSDEFLGSLGYSYDQRRGDQYNKNVFFRASYTDSYEAGTSGRFTQHPSMRSFLFNDYNEHRVKMAGNWTATETLSLQGGIDSFRRTSPTRSTDCARFGDELHASTITAALNGACLGRTLAEGLSASVDAQWQPEDNLTTYAFLNFAMTGTEQQGLEFVTKTNADAANLNRLWKASLTNYDNTLGFGLKWQPKEQWDLGGNYVFNRGKGTVDIIAGSTANGVSGTTPAGVRPVTPVPQSESALHTLQLFAKWNYSKQLTWRFNYWYENLTSYDWAYDTITATSSTQALYSGQSSPKYENHVVGVSAAIHSW